MAQPALTRASPSGAIAGTYQPLDHVQKEVLMDDGSWGYCEAMGWARDASGAWRIRLLRYGTDEAGRRTQLEDWWLYDPAMVRDPALLGAKLGAGSATCAAAPAMWRGVAADSAGGGNPAH